MDDRNRAAPVALAADAPIAQAELGAGLAEAFALQGSFHGVERAVEIQPVEFVGIDQLAMLTVGVVPRCRRLVTCAGSYHGLDRQVVLGRKGEVALVMGRNGHHCAFAVIHQHVVGDPHRQQFASEWVLHLQCSGKAFLFLGGDVGFSDAAALAFINERLQF